eukprot:TRINITY_DN106498_c0_g1_i1.p1 TRINITY_DN106498_c0_g1~~TRINITY_DN106498_c0_g1_i1.p1  ORF type:complete len:479 (-),score=106.85 TRINITY_DN106498_c0_g1_i1:9-1445(-)
MDDTNAALNPAPADVNGHQQRCCRLTAKRAAWASAAVLVLAAAAVGGVYAGIHHGKPGPSPSPPPTPPPPPSPAPPSPAPPSPTPPAPPGVLRGVAYGALPCSMEVPCKGPLPGADMVQIGYEEQWGSKGRNDLGVMKRLGANAVRLYHSMGAGAGTDHGAFLDAAHAEGLDVFPGIETDLAIHNCSSFDCFETFKSVVKQSFSLGFANGTAWHPAVHTVILLNEPDFLVNDPSCPGQAAWCRVKATISALDAILVAEKEAGITAGRVKLTTTWSFAAVDSIDGKCLQCPGYFGFHDMLAVIADPSIANYKPRSLLKDMQAAFHGRWVNSLNVQAPFKYVHDLISKNYAPFGNMPWFIGEYGALDQPRSVIEGDLKSMDELAKSDDPFFGGAMFQFQTAYYKGGSEMHFGIFSLGSSKIGDTGDVCTPRGCKAWPVFCLSTTLPWLPGTQGQRAEAVATAWGGNIEGTCASPGLDLLV